MYLYLQPLQQAEWFGNARGYNISYKEILSSSVALNTTSGETFIHNNVTIDDPTANSYILDNLREYTLYEIVMIAFNDVGFSLSSPSAIERTRESGEFVVFAAKQTSSYVTQAEERG